MADRYWIANLEANQLWTTATNWADNANGTGANTVPLANDNVHFGHATTLAAGKGFGSCELGGNTETLAKFTSYEGYNKIEMTSKFSILGATRFLSVSPVGSTSPLQAGFKVGMVITIAGCADADNNGLFQIATLGAGIMTLTTAGSGSSMANETAGNDVTITYDPLLDLKGSALNMTSPAGGTLMTLNSKIGNGTGTGTINFSGAFVGGAGSRYLLCGDKQALANVDSITMNFTPISTLYFDDGIYGTVQLNAGTYTCDYVTPTSAEYQGVYFYKFRELAATTWVNAAGGVRNNIKKKFYVQNTTSFALLTKNFNTGYSTWCFDTDISFSIPTSGDYINYPTGFTVRWYNLIIKNSGGNVARKATIPARRNLQVNSLTVETGANVEGEKAPSLSGTADKGSSTITSNTRPTIKGSWNFTQVADGVYSSILSESYSITPSHGDRRAVQLSYGGGAFDSHPKFNWGFDKEALVICDGAFISSSFYEFCQSYAVADGSTINNTIWITNATPSVPYFTDSQGNHHNLLAGGGGGGMTSWSIGSTTGTNQTVSNGEVVDVVGGTGISGAIGGTRTITLDLDDTAVTAATYGSATQSPVIAIDAQGRITSASNASIPITINTDQKVKINALDSAAGFLEDKIVAGTGLNTSLAIVAPHGTQLSLNNESLAFKTIAVAGQTDVVADLLADTLTLVAGSNMTITTNALSDTITFASSGGGGGGSNTVSVYDEGVFLGDAQKMDFTGAGVTASFAGTTATVNIPSGGGGGGQPLFKHDQNPTSSNFNPHRLLVHNDTIEVGLATGSGKNVDVFTPAITSDGANRMITINATGASATNTGREYIFFGQFGDRSTGDPVVYQFDNSGGSLTVPHYFIHHMSQVKLPATAPNFSFIVTHQLRIVPMTSVDSGFTPPNAVRVVDAGQFTLLNPSLDEENPIPHRLFLVTDIPYDFQARVITAFLGKNFS